MRIPKRHRRPPAPPPPDPPWVRPDGTVDPEVAARTTVPVAGPDGEPLRDQNGEVVMVPLSGFDPPPAP